MAKEETKVEDDIKIEVVDDPVETETTTEVKVEAKPDPAAVKVDTDPNSGVADLQRQLAASNARLASEQRARREADARATSAGNTVNQTRAEAVAAYEVSAKSAKASGEASLKAAKSRFKSAMESSNFDEAAEAQAEIATATNTISGANYQLTQLESVKKQLGDSANAAQRTSTAATAERRTESENVRDTSGGRTKSWIDAHPAFHSDINFYNKAMSAHYAALRDGVEPESDAYFEALNKGVTGGTAEVAKVAPAVTTSTAAAASRSTTQTRNERPEMVRLTKAQMEAAEIAGMKPQDYARHLLALQAENKIGRTTH